MQLSGNKVLVVEDSRAINSLLTHSIISQLDIPVESAATMAQAKLLIEKAPDDFFIAILDLNLPDAPDGEIVNYVMDQNIPVIVLTGSINDQINNKLISKGVIDYVVKRNLNEIQYVIDTVERLKSNFNNKVLVVDDSKTSRQMTRALLENQFLTVIEAVDGKDGIDKLNEHKDITLVVTDYNMPNMNGMEFISKIRETHSRHDMAIIGISASTSNDTSIKLLKSGANDFISRPFQYEEFYCRVNQNIDSITHYRKILDAATKDFLTGLFNRKYIFETGNKLFDNARRKNVTISVAMLDIDFFKKINDTYGHHIGDLALKHIAAILSQQLREGDILARMGGEEFCILCVNANETDSKNLFERIRQAIESEPLVTNDITINITVSIGYCIELEDSLDKMINNADAALYTAKETGRNKIHCYN